MALVTEAMALATEAMALAMEAMALMTEATALMTEATALTSKTTASVFPATVLTHTAMAFNIFNILPCLYRPLMIKYLKTDKTISFMFNFNFYGYEQ
jgi:hypothetical protein